MPDFYHQYPGRVISTTIDKFVYLSINPTHLLNKFIMKYQTTEIVSDPREIKHDRVREALLDLKIKNGLEITSSADIAARTGLGSSSSFSVALVKGLNYYMGRSMSRVEAAEEACRLEIGLLKEPIGKQDQYAASFGGFNIFQFNPDETVTVESILIDYKKRARFEDHLVLFFTGISRNASTVLGDQRTKIEKNFETYKQMSDSVYDFRDKLMAGDLEGLAAMLHEGWLRKKSLAQGVSSSLIDVMYETGIKSGAWGGKILGAGGGGCLLFLASPDKHEEIKTSLKKFAEENNLPDAQAIPFKFTQSGTDILYSSSVPRFN